jgi:hypothetical protein
MQAVLDCIYRNVLRALEQGHLGMLTTLVQAHRRKGRLLERTWDSNLRSMS